jgi:hypothetical protein
MLYASRHIGPQKETAEMTPSILPFGVRRKARNRKSRRHPCVIIYGPVRYLEFHAQSKDNITCRRYNSVHAQFRCEDVH